MMTNNAETHRLLILGSMDEFLSLVRRAKERGYYTIVCDGYPQGPAKVIADKSYNIDVRDVDSIAAMCRDEHVDGIISSFSDVLAENLVSIATAVGLPTYLSPANLTYLRDKSKMKGMFDQLGIPYPKSRIVRLASASHDMAGLEFPVVTKPVNAYGSHGVYLLHSPEEVTAHFQDVQRYADSDSIIVEEYNDGYEFNMMNWVVDGVPVVLEIADREKSVEIDNVTPHVSRIVYPSRLTDVVYEEAYHIVEKVAGFVGMENGPLCMQFFYRPGKGIEVCECAGRIFGYEHELLEYASCGNLSIEELLLDYVYDREGIATKLAGHDPHLSRVAAGLYFHGYEGTVARVEGLPMQPGGAVVESLPYYQVGDTISHSVGAKPYAARVYLVGDTYDAVDAATDELFASVHMYDRSGRQLIYHNERCTFKI